MLEDACMGVNFFAVIIWTYFIGAGLIGGGLQKLMPDHKVLAVILGALIGFITGAIISMIIHPILMAGPK